MNRDRAEGRTGADWGVQPVRFDLPQCGSRRCFDFLAHVHNCPVCTPLVFTAPACWAINFDWLRETKWVRKRARGGLARSGGPCVHMFGLVKMSC